MKSGEIKDYITLAYLDASIRPIISFTEEAMRNQGTFVDNNNSVIKYLTNLEAIKDVYQNRSDMSDKYKAKGLKVINETIAVLETVQALSDSNKESRRAKQEKTEKVYTENLSKAINSPTVKIEIDSALEGKKFPSTREEIETALDLVKGNKSIIDSLQTYASSKLKELTTTIQGIDPGISFLPNIFSGEERFAKNPANQLRVALRQIVATDMLLRFLNKKELNALQKYDIDRDAITLL